MTTVLNVSATRESLSASNERCSVVVVIVGIIACWP